MWKIEMRAPESETWEQVPGQHNEDGAKYMAGLVAQAFPFHAVRKYHEDNETRELFYPRLGGETEAQFEARGRGRVRG